MLNCACHDSNRPDQGLMADRDSLLFKLGTLKVDLERNVLLGAGRSVS